MMRLSLTWPVAYLELWVEGCARGTEELLNGPAAHTVSNTSEGIRKLRQGLSSVIRSAPEVALRAVVRVCMEQTVLTVILCGGAETS